jgi:hypothetical protein
MSDKNYNNSFVNGGNSRVSSNNSKAMNASGPMLKTSSNTQSQNGISLYNTQKISSEYLVSSSINKNLNSNANLQYKNYQAQLTNV